MKRIKAMLKERVRDERGAALVVTLMILAVMSAIGIAATDTATMEVIISGAQRDQRVAFYTAEAGIEHTKGILKSLFVASNSSKIAAGGSGDWDFALDGSQDGVAAATGTPPTFAGGAVWINNGTFGGRGSYTVTVWNNDDGGTATNDTDGKFMIRSVAAGTGGGTSAVEITVNGFVTGGGAVTGYSAQAGGGSGKAYTAEDAEAIDAADLTTQQISVN
jgi:type IV pilus assembly protein PilX